MGRRVNSQDYPDPVDPDEDTEEIRRLAFLRDVEEETRKLRVRDAARTAWNAEQRGPVNPPQLLTLRERLALPRPPTLWRIRDWQPAGSRVVTAAQFKAGKTTLIGNLIRSLVDGDDWLGRHQVIPVTRTVTLLDFEMSPSQLDDWYRAQGIRNDDRVHIEPMRGRATAFNLLDDRVHAQWAELLRERKTGYLVVDCLRPILDALGIDEQREAGRFLVPLDRLLTEAGIDDANLVHHMGHQGERSRGDSRIRDWPEIEWRLVRENDEPASARFISAYGRDVDQHESQLAYDSQTRHLTLDGGSRTDQKHRRALDDVLAALDEAKEPLTGRAVEMVLAGSDHSRATIRGALKLGIRDGEIIPRPGPRGATLHEKNPSAPVRRTAPPVRRRSEVSAPVRSIDGALHGAHGEEISAPPVELPLPLVEPDCPDCFHPLDSDDHGRICEVDAA